MELKKSLFVLSQEICKHTFNNKLFTLPSQINIINALDNNFKQNCCLLFLFFWVTAIQVVKVNVLYRFWNHITLILKCDEDQKATFLKTCNQLQTVSCNGVITFSRVTIVINIILLCFGFSIFLTQFFSCVWVYYTALKLPCFTYLGYFG